MSNTLLNKLKTVDASRQNLEQLLNTKGLNVGSNNSLDSLIGNVSRLDLYEEVPEEWTGIPDEPEPTNYYKGDDDWKDLIDVDAIMTADDAESYFAAKIFVLFRVSDNPLAINNLPSGSFQDTPTAIRYSDTQDKIYMTNGRRTGYTSENYYNHTWDSTKDIVATNGERFRWMIIYEPHSNTNHYSTGSTSTGFMWCSRSFLPEAVWYWQGTWWYTAIQDSPYDITLYYKTNSYRAIGSDYYSRYSKCPKYIEMKPNCKTLNMIGSVEGAGGEYYIDYRLRTCILNGEVIYSFKGPKAYNLEYFKANNLVSTPYDGTSYGNSYFCSNFNNPNIRTKIYINSISTLHYLSYSDNAYIKINNIKNSIYECNYGNRDLDFKLGTVGYIYDSAFNNSSGNGEQYSVENCNFDIQTSGSIGSAAFKKNKGHIKINKITGGVGSRAFYYCQNMMKNVIIANENHETTTRYSIGGAAFAYSSAEVLDMTDSLINYCANTSNSPDQSSYSEYFAFAFSNLKHIKFSQYMTDMGYYLFYNLVTLKSVTIQEGVTTINESAFYGCGITSLVLPSTLTNLGYNCFKNCENLTSITFTDDILTSIPSYTFAGCLKLTNVQLPTNITSISDYAFDGCGITSLVLPDKVTTLGTYCFKDCVNLNTITQVSPNLTSIGSYCFEFCHNLTTLPNLDKVTTLGDYVFKACDNLELVIPKKVNVSLSTNAYTHTRSKNITVPSDIFLAATLNLNGADWSITSLMKLLRSLPDRSATTAYTVRIGGSTHQSSDAGSDYYVSYYQPAIYNGYVHDDGEKLIWSTTPTAEGDLTVAQYVSNKNWTIS